MRQNFTWSTLPIRFDYLKLPVEKAVLEYGINDDLKFAYLLENITEEYYKELVQVGAMIKQRGDFEPFYQWIMAHDWTEYGECFGAIMFLELLDMLDIDAE